MRRKKPEDILEEAVKDRTIPDDPELASLARMADRLERGMNVEPPDPYRERALFIQGAAARKPGFPWARLMVPVMAAAVTVAAVAIGRDARPGDALWGFRKALDRVGLAEDPARSARRVLDDAEGEVAEAETFLEEERFARARRTALDALVLLREAQTLLEGGSGEAREAGLERLEDLRERAHEVQEEAIEEQQERIEERIERARERLEERIERARERREERREERRDRRRGGSGSGSGSRDG